MVQAAVTHEKLSSTTMDAVFASLASILPTSENRSFFSLNLSLRSVRFLDPYGMCCLWAALNFLNQHIRKLSLELPDDSGVQQYMERIGFLSLLEDSGIQFSNAHAVRSSHRPTSDVLLEMTVIAGEDDVRRMTATILDRVARILQTQLDYSSSDVANFTTTLTEACRNIADHSESLGVACAQSYTNTQGERFVTIAVADYGMGIRSSLASRYSNALDWTHGQAIEMSLRKAASRLPDRGLGLYHITQIVSQYRGSFHIRSGDTRLLLRSRATHFTGEHFPGTQLCITLMRREA